jgi:hypothetical protein
VKLVLNFNCNENETICVLARLVYYEKNNEFAEGTDFMSVKPVDKKFSMGSNKIYTFFLSCEEVISIRIETSAIFRK